MSSRYSISTNPLEYASEVAYIVATSPTSAGAGAIGGPSDDEFEFTLEGQGPEESTQGGRGGGGVSTKAAEGKETGEPGREDGGRVRKKAQPKFPAEETDFAADVAASPGEASLQELQKMVVIYGPTGYANRQLVIKLVQSNPSIFTLVVPHTSRKRAQSEINGIDFHFVDRKEMSSQIRKGNFIECVKISSPKLKFRKASATVSTNPASASPSPASPTEQSPVSPVSASPASATVVNPWSNIVQVPSPLLTPNSRQRARKSTKSCELFGTSKEAIHKARLLGKPCIVLSVTHKGAEQLKKAGYEGVYILLDVGGDGSEQTDAAETSEHSLQPDHTITAGNTEQAFSELQQHAFHTVSSLPLSPRSKFDITRDEWENLPTVEMDQQPSEASSPISKVRLLTFNNLLVHYQRERIGTRPAKTKKVPTLAKGLRTECNLVLSLSEMQLSDTDPIHIEALHTIYQKLMGSALNCRRYGPHWQDIGFLGVDPAENLKEVGFFGIMQLIYLLDRSLPLTLEIFTYSREGTYQFPFAIVSINITQIALNSLRNGCLTKLCNKHDQVFITLNEYYMGMFHRFFLLWKSQQQSSSSSQMGPVIRDVEGYAKRHPKNVIADLLAYLDSGKDKHEKIAIRKISQSLSNPFTPFDKLAEEQELQATLPSTPPPTT